MKRFINITAIAVMAVLAVSACNSSNKKAEGEEKSQNTETSDTAAIKKTEIKMEEVKMEMEKIEEPEFDIITTHGTMRVKLYDKTPKHRDNFVKLVSEKFYDGIRFHRVIEGFMIQTGDPLSRDTSNINLWGTGGPTPEYTVPAEFVSEYTHKKGALAAARRGDAANPKKASSGSQFYIVHDENVCKSLDGQYTIFGEVVSGLEIIDKIASVDTDRYDRPYEDVMIKCIKPVEVSPAVPKAKTDTTGVNTEEKSE